MMNALVRFLLVLCGLLTVLSIASAQIAESETLPDSGSTEETIKPEQSEELLPTASIEDSDNIEVAQAVNARSIANSYEVEEVAEEEQKDVNGHEEFKRRAKPLKNIFMGIYKNYKSTYLGNKTSQEYKKTLRDRLTTSTTSTVAPSTEEPAELHEYHYNVGAGVNMSLDLNNDIVNVHLNGDNLREIMQGRWLNDNTEQGRGKKYDMVTKVLPLFILPFLIQSAIVPFLVTKLKLLLMKSILVGKLAIFLLILSAIKNSNKMMQTYEVPSYWAAEPSRRSELAAASAAAYNGYRVEGKPTTWIN